MVKPEHVDRADEIFNDLENMTNGKKIWALEVECVPREVAEEQYGIHRGRVYHGKPVYGLMVKSIAGKRVVIAIFQGEGVIERTRRAIGDKDPLIARPWTIRARYAKGESLEKALERGEAVRNAVHASDSQRAFERELSVWSGYVPQS